MTEAFWTSTAALQKEAAGTADWTAAFVEIVKIAGLPGGAGAPLLARDYLRKHYNVRVSPPSDNDDDAPGETTRVIGNVAITIGGAA